MVSKTWHADLPATNCLRDNVDSFFSSIYCCMVSPIAVVGIEQVTKSGRIPQNGSIVEALQYPLQAHRKRPTSPPFSTATSD